MTDSLLAAPAARPELVATLTAPKGFGDATLRERRADAIELLGGIPDPSVLPTGALAAAAERVLSVAGVPALQYSRTEGIPALRDWIAAREGVPSSRIIVTNGGFHGLSLAIQAIVERGDLVAVDNPIFPLFLRGLQLSAGRILPIRVGAHGLDVDELATRLREGARPTAVYTVPDFHNPSGGTLPSDARRELVDLAERYGFVVLADNPYRELRFRGEDQDVRAFNDSDHVVHVNTFTKTLGPGLRLGWIVVPERFRSDVVALRSRQDGHSSTFVQSVVAEAVTAEEGFFDDVLAGARALYRERSDTLADALESAAPGVFAIDRPEGGLFLWPRILDEALDGERLADDASLEGVEYQRGSFFPSGPGTDSDRRLRLAYGDVPTEKLPVAAERIAAAVARQR